MRVLFVGDVVGRPGRKTLRDFLPGLIDRHKPALVIANGENAAGGFGINEKVASEMFASGVDIITTGNHVWDKLESLPLLSKEDRVLRPANYPPGAPGAGSIVITARDGGRAAVLNVSGRVFMNALDCPFAVAEREIEKLSASTPRIIVDFHAEATSEKEAFGFFLDGRASAVLGTHTHVQTADARVLPRGTAYITDVGMTGPEDAVIGMDKGGILRRFTTGMPQRFEVAKGPCVLGGAVVEIDDSTGRAASIERILLRSS